jgi:hypothetical protein
MLAIADTEQLQDMNMAKDIADTLFVQYPGYMWGVNVTSGVAVIKCLNVSSNHGFVLHYSQIKDDAGFRKKEVLRAGGEILERAGMRRGSRRVGEKAVKVDGIDNYNPIAMR